MQPRESVPNRPHRRPRGEIRGRRKQKVARFVPQLSKASSSSVKKGLAWCQHARCQSSPKHGGEPPRKGSLVASPTLVGRFPFPGKGQFPWISGARWSLSASFFSPEKNGP